MQDADVLLLSLRPYIPQPCRQLIVSQNAWHIEKAIEELGEEETGVVFVVTAVENHADTVLPVYGRRSNVGRFSTESVEQAAVIESSRASRKIAQSHHSFERFNILRSRLWQSIDLDVNFSIKSCTWHHRTVIIELHESMKLPADDRTLVYLSGIHPSIDGNRCVTRELRQGRFMSTVREHGRRIFHHEGQTCRFKGEVQNHIQLYYISKLYTTASDDTGDGTESEQTNVSQPATPPISRSVDANDEASISSDATDCNALFDMFLKRSLQAMEPQETPEAVNAVLNVSKTIEHLMESHHLTDVISGMTQLLGYRNINDTLARILDERRERKLEGNRTMTSRQGTTEGSPRKMSPVSMESTDDGIDRTASLETNKRCLKQACHDHSTTMVAASHHTSQFLPSSRLPALTCLPPGVHQLPPGSMTPPPEKAQQPLLPEDLDRPISCRSIADLIRDDDHARIIVLVHEQSRAKQYVDVFLSESINAVHFKNGKLKSDNFLRQIQPYKIIVANPQIVVNVGDDLLQYINALVEPVDITMGPGFKSLRDLFSQRSRPNISWIKIIPPSFSVAQE